MSNPYVERAVGTRTPIQTGVLFVIVSFAAPHLHSVAATKATPPISSFLCPDPPQYSVTVSPHGGTASWAEGTTGHTAQFTVLNGPCTDTYTFSVTASGPISGVSLNKTSQGLTGGASTTVTATYNVDNPGSGQLTLTATGSVGGATDGGYYTVTATLPAGAPVVDPSAINFLIQDYSRCANSCFAALTSFATVPYFSLDAPRNAILVYNSDRGNPRPFVLANVSPDLGYGSWPTEYQLRVLVNGAEVRFANGQDTLRFQFTGTSPVRLGGQFDASSYATNVYRMDVLVTSVFSGGPVTNDYVTKFISVNRTNVPVARGWAFGKVQQLFLQSDGSAVVVEGDGSAVYFANTGGGFTSPSGEFSRLITSSLSGTNGWARVFPDSTKVVFTSAGLMTRVLDGFGNRDSVVYDASNRVSKLIDPQNLAITMTYGSNGLASIQDPQGRTTAVTVDASNRLTAISDPDNVATSYGYDASVRLSTITDRRGSTTTFGYDNGGKVATITAPAVEVVNSDGSVTTASPITTLEAWLEKGVPYGSTSPPVTPPLRDTVYARVTDPGGHTTRLTVNSWGTAAYVTNSLGLTDSTFFDTNGLPFRTIHSTGAVDTIVFNSSGLPTYVKPYGLNARNISYAGWAQPDSVWGTQMPPVKNFIGANGRVDSTRTWGNAGAAVTRFTYQTDGRVNQIIDPESHLAARTWYAGTNGNRSRDSLPGNRQTTYAYDSNGRRTSTAAPGVATHFQVFDAVNRVTRDSMVGLPATVYAYDSLFLRSVTDANGQLYSFAHNALGWMTARTDPASHADTLKYDRDGLLRRSQNRRGQVVVYTYDAGHRAVTKSGTNTDTTSWVYSSDNRIVSSTSPWAVDSQFFGASGMLDSIRTKLAGQTFVQRFLYTGSGALDSVNVVGGGITFMARKYVWDTQRNILSTIRLSGGEATSVASNRDRQLTATTFPHGDTVSVAHTSVHTDASISTNAAYAPASDEYVTFDPANRISRRIDGTGLSGTDFFYDSYGRLTWDSTISYQGAGNPCTGYPPPIVDDNGQTCTYSGTWLRTGGQSFSYDSVGNRRDQNGSYASGNRIRQFAGCTYVPDSLGDGNVLSRTCGSQTIRFYWTAESRLIAAKVVGSDSLDFHYDAIGRLIRSDLNGAAQSYFLWQGSNLLAELNATATAKVAEYSYYQGLDNPHSIILGTTPFFSHQDVGGNVVALTNDSAALQRSYAYDAWGQLTGGSDIKPFANLDRARYKGALWLGTDLDMYYMRNRWYEPKTGRFLSEDPIGIAGGLNQYLYSGDDPINGSDPVGTCSYITETNEYPSGAVVSFLVSVDCGDELSGLISSVRSPGLGGPGSEGGEGGVPGSPAVANLGTQGNACWGAFVKLTVNVLVDASALTGIGEGAFLVAKGVGRLAAGALLNTAARSAATYGFDVAGRQAFLGTVASGARAFAELGADQITQGGLRAAEAYGPEATLAAAAAGSQQHSLSLWDFVPGHGTWVAFKEYMNCRKGVQ
jgi:RHS repeat-associated protein